MNEYCSIQFLNTYYVLNIYMYYLQPWQELCKVDTCILILQMRKLRPKHSKQVIKGRIAPT